MMSKPIKPQLENIPDELKEYDNWLLWNSVSLKGGKLGKRPVNLEGQAFKGWNDTDNLYSFEVVADAYKKGNFTGIGFSQKNTPFVCIDLDNDNSIDDIPDEMLSIVHEGYAERSPSGNGVHVWMQADLPDKTGKKRKTDAGDEIELFTHTGWLTVTGDVLENNPIADKQKYVTDLAYKYSFLEKEQPKPEPQPTTDFVGNFYDMPASTSATGNQLGEQEIIDKMLSSQSGHDIQRLLNGDTSAYENDNSSADMALAGYLAFWTNRDASMIDSIFRQTGLMRDKWDRKTGNTTYGAMTIDEAIKNAREGYTGQREQRPAPDASNPAKTSKADSMQAVEQQAREQVAEMNLTEKTLNDLTSTQINVLTDEQRKELYLKTSAKNYVQSFLDGVTASANTPAIPTGFDKLDDVLEGGLYEGLYFIGAISSLGKTTFVLQIADQIAQNGQDVIVFSLEMARTELMAKSISRLTLTNALEKDLPSGYPKTTRGITAGKRYTHYVKDEKRLITDSVQSYNEYAGNLYIQEGIGTIGADEIRETVERHKDYTGNTPVVMIDYLQILAPEDTRATDKQNTDSAVLKLKRLSRDFKLPVIGISSFNRDNYTNKVSMRSFKESGAIEYSSDVLIGLQFSRQREVDEYNKNKKANEPKKIVDADAEKAKDPREIELKILKNRNGATGGSIDYEFHPKFNYFVEQDEQTEQIETGTGKQTF